MKLRTKSIRCILSVLLLASLLWGTHAMNEIQEPEEIYVRFSLPAEVTATDGMARIQAIVWSNLPETPGVQWQRLNVKTYARDLAAARASGRTIQREDYWKDIAWATGWTLTISGITEENRSDFVYRLTSLVGEKRFSSGEADIDFVIVTTTPTPSTTPMPEITVTPVPEVTVTPVPEVTETPIPEVTVTPVPEVTETPVPEVTVTPVPEVTETPIPEVTVTPVPEITETPIPEVTVTPVPDVTETPTPEVIETPVPEVTVTPVPEVTVTPVPEVTETPIPEVTETPIPEVTETPIPEVTETPIPEVTVTPVPEITVTPIPEITVTPVPEVTVTPVPEVTETPVPEVTETPVPEVTETPVPEVTETPVPEVIETPVPEVTETPVPEVTVTPVPEVTETPIPEVTVTPVPEVTVTPVPEVTETPIPEVTETPVPEVTETPVPEVTVTPVPEVTETPIPEVTETPVPEVTETPVPEVTATPVPETTVPMPETAGILHPYVTPIPGSEIIIMPTQLGIDLGEEKVHYVDDSWRLKVIRTPDFANAKVTWRSSDEKVLTVDAIGQVTAHSIGTATVTVQASNGVAASVELVVSPPIRPTMMILNYSGSISLNQGETLTLIAAFYPHGAAATMGYTSSKPSVATVSPDGVIHAIKAGQAVITGKSSNGLSASVTVRVVNPYAPTRVTLDQEGTIVLSLTEKLPLQVSCEPLLAQLSLVWTSSSTAVTVSQTGLVTPVHAGTATITVSGGNGVSDSVTVRVVDPYAPDRVTIAGAPEEPIPVGASIQLAPVLTPTTANATFTWESSNQTVATVDETGKVTTHEVGTVQIRVTTHNGKMHIVTMTVIDPNRPYELTLHGSSTYMQLGEKMTLVARVQPAYANAECTWTSGYPSIATVDAHGVVTARGYGVTLITATAKHNPELSATYTLTVLNPARTLAMPARRTNTAAIESNLSAIRAVQSSANQELLALYADGKITKAEGEARSAVIANAFAMYAFPWMTLNTQVYWKEANSENGAKYFRPGTVYYGLPYTSGATGSRQYNVEKALNNGHYYLAASGRYYLLDQTHLLENRYYVGNDCSSFVCMAYFGPYAGSYSFMRTDMIYNDQTRFKTISASDLRPGDLLVLSGRHVVMFLYYADAAHKQIVVIEQGGNEPAINTVSTSVYELAYYTKQGYIARRLRKYA